MQLTRIKKATVNDTVIYMLGIGLKSDYEKKKLENFLKESEIPLEKLESYYDKDLVIIVTKFKVNDKNRKYEYLVIFAGKEEKAFNYYKILKDYIKSQEEKKKK